MVADRSPILDYTTRTIAPSQSGECLSEEDVRRRFAGLLPAADAEKQERHLDRCDICRAMVERLMPMDMDVPVVELGRMGRFELLEPLGEGGMGRVFRAYDPQLDRYVAIKLLRTRTRSCEGPRLLREAQALAQLNHPNILPIYDMGSVDGGAPGGVYLAMQLVEGQNLRQWLDAEPRSVSALLEHFIAAGRGLQAAHDADLVHRDFKPTNVMVGDDGRCMVMDFGLARRIGTTSDVGGESVEPEPLVNDQWITEAGAVLGTPAFMSPEQFLGRQVDARTDQFSFCVALWIALFGEHPFGGPDFKQTVLGGARRATPEGHEVSSTVVDALVKGLSIEPTSRHASMAVLLTALSVEPRSRSTRWLVGVGAAAVAAVAAAASLYPARTEPSIPMCDGEARISEVWNEQRAASVRDAFASTELALAMSTRERVVDRLNGYRDRWVSAYDTACQARVRPGDATGERDEAMLCLNERRDAMAQLIRVFEAADRTVVHNAAQAVLRLADADRCTETTGSIARAPADPELRAQVSSVEEMLQEVEALDNAGLYEDAVARAKQAAKHGLAVDYPPLHARIHLAMGLARSRVADFDGGSEQLEEAVNVASAHGLDDVVAQASLHLVESNVNRGSEIGDIRRWLRHADAATTRQGDPPAQRARYLTLAGEAELDAGNYERGEQMLEQGLELNVTHQGPRSLEALMSHIALAGAAERRGRIEDALARHQLALELERELLGPAHPLTVGTLRSIRDVHRSRGDSARARAIGGEIIPLLVEAYGPDHPRVAWAWVSEAGLLVAEGDYQGGLDRLDQALAIAQPLESLDPGLLGLIHTNRGAALGYLGRAEEAVTTMRLALRLIERDDNTKQYRLAVTLDNLGYALHEAGRPEEALPYHERALVLWETVAPGSSALAISLTDQCRSLVATGQSSRAVPLAERAVALFEGQKVDPFELARAREVLARALFGADGDKERIATLVREAHSGYASDPRRGDKPLAALEAWSASIE